MFVTRSLSKKILAGATQVPVVAIVGPRQSGKSTLAKELFPKHTYVDMQDAAMFEFANQDPKGFLQTHANEHGIIIDEAQYVPRLFPQIKVEADKNPKPGYYVLSGSQNFLLQEKISESLAGRAYFYHLLPFSIAELKSAHLLEQNPTEQLFKGFYPRVYQERINVQEYYKNYIATYVERDIRLIRNIENTLTFQKFMQLCALRIGSPLNMSDIAANCGISVLTAKNWLSLLETSFVLFLLPSYHENLGKRITKSPKLYFYDVGLATMLVDANPETIVKQRVLYGALFENMIIVDVIKNLQIQANHYTATFFRDTAQQEIDLIIEMKGKILPVEIKAGEMLKSNVFDIAQWFQEQTGSLDPLVIYGGTQKQIRSVGKVLPWSDIADIF